MNEQLLRQIIREELAVFLSGCDNQQQNDELFDGFWKVYPRKVGKKKARILWDRLSPSKKLAIQIISAVKKQKQTIWKDSGLEYVPHPATWLNGQRWEDEIPENSEDDMPQIRRPTDDELALIREP